MTLAVAGLCLAAIWLVVHAVKRQRRLLLPLTHTRGQAVELTVRHLTIRLRTETLNGVHGNLSAQLNSRTLRHVLLRFYGMGSVVGIVGMLLGFGLLLLTAASLSREILQAGHPTVTKRGLEDSTPRINPIIPGLTVPLSHLPLILVALVVSQVVHEAGHAIAAAVHHIPMLSCGVAVTVLFPSAFVTLSAAHLEKLSPRNRLQIISAGCFHNFLLFCFLFTVAWLWSTFLPTWILFQDISGLGRLVLSVDYDSPLADHLPVGTLVTKIDDFPMASVSSDDHWSRYLLSPSPGSLQGWCANDFLLDKWFTPACASIGSYSCFVSKTDNAIQYKLDPVAIFTNKLLRCNSSTECSTSSSCIVPRRDEQLVRISVWRGHAEDVVVWKGPKKEIWEQVQVTRLRPRFPLVSSMFPTLASTFFEYMKIANLSLYVMNMLPIMALDGYQSLVALLQLICGRVSDGLEVIDLEALSNTTRSSREGAVQRMCRSFLSFLAPFLVGLCGLLGVINWAKK